MAADVDEASVAHTRRTRRLAAAARQTAVEVQLRLRRHVAAFERLLDQVDPPARTVELVAEQLIRRTRRRAEAAVHACAQDRIGFAPLGRFQQRRQQLRFHQSSAKSRPRLSTRCGSKTCFRRRCSATIGDGSGWNTPADLSAPRYSVAWPPCSRGPCAKLRRRCAIHHDDPAQRAAPLHHLFTRHVEPRRRRTHGQPPQCSVALRRRDEALVRLIANGSPERVAVDLVAADSLGCRRNRRGSRRTVEPRAARRCSTSPTPAVACRPIR